MKIKCYRVSLYYSSEQHPNKPSLVGNYYLVATLLFSCCFVFSGDGVEVVNVVVVNTNLWLA